MKRITVVAALVLAACSPNTSNISNTSLATETGQGITAQSIRGAWVFSHSPNGGSDALHTGFASIEEGCLLVDGAVVIWHEGDLMRAGDLVEAVLAGERPMVAVGGGGIGLAEAGDVSLFPDIVVERCRTDTLWYGSEG